MTSWHSASCRGNDLRSACRTGCEPSVGRKTEIVPARGWRARRMERSSRPSMQQQSGVWWSVSGAPPCRAKHERSCMSKKLVDDFVRKAPVIPTYFNEKWNYDNGPLPPEFWSTVQDLPEPYRWRYRMATEEEEETVLGMQLPEAHDWAALRAWNRRFSAMAMEVIRTRKSGRRAISDFIGNEWGVPPDDVPENLVRIWLYLLAGRLMTPEDCDKMFDQGYFAGAVMPCPATGGGVVRELACGSPYGDEAHVGG